MNSIEDLKAAVTALDTLEKEIESMKNSVPSDYNLALEHMAIIEEKTLKLDNLRDALLGKKRGSAKRVTSRPRVASGEVQKAILRTLVGTFKTDEVISQVGTMYEAASIRSALRRLYVNGKIEKVARGVWAIPPIVAAAEAGPEPEVANG